jgi:hypothetical protein
MLRFDSIFMLRLWNSSKEINGPFSFSAVRDPVLSLASAFFWVRKLSPGNIGQGV